MANWINSQLDDGQKIKFYFSGLLFAQRHQIVIMTFLWNVIGIQLAQSHKTKIFSFMIRCKNWTLYYLILASLVFKVCKRSKMLYLNTWWFRVYLNCIRYCLKLLTSMSSATLLSFCWLFVKSWSFFYFVYYFHVNRCRWSLLLSLGSSSASLLIKLNGTKQNFTRAVAGRKLLLFCVFPLVILFFVHNLWKVEKVFFMFL